MRLLTGIVNNPSQHIDKILLWQKSFLKVCPYDNVVLMVVNATEEDKKLLENNNIKCEYLDTEQNETINNLRLLPMSKFIDSIKNHYDKVIYTDVFDVVFLKDPFSKLAGYDLSSGSEGILQSEEPWNSDVMNKCFPSFYNFMSDKEILCSGIIAGTPIALSNLLKQMYDICTTSLKGHDIEDQAALNIVHHHNSYENNIQVLQYPEKWALHIATGGPTQFFDAWGFRNILKKRYNMTPKWQEFDIVHQFNRVPSIHEQLKKMYE